MKILVGQHELKIDKKDKVNQNEYKITKCEFEFDEAITNDLVKIALFTNSAGTYKQYIINNECDIPAEILKKQETTTLGVYAYKEENGELELRYSPEEIKFYVSNGSYKEDAENTEPITPTDKEQMEQAISDMETKVDNLDIKAEKVDKTTTITITKKDGTPEEVKILDGEDGVSLENMEIVNRNLKVTYGGETENLGQVAPNIQVGTTTTGLPNTNASVVNVGTDLNPILNFTIPKGEAGSIKFEIVEQLPTQDIKEDTIYLVPYTKITVQTLPTENIQLHTIYIIESTGKRYVYNGNEWIEISNDNQYIEYVYINNSWEELGSIGVDINLDDYYTKTETNTLLSGKVGFTDYASSSVGGVIKYSNYYGTSVSNVGVLSCQTKAYNIYTNSSLFGDNGFISKGTLENVISGKGLVSNTDYATDSASGVLKTNFSNSFSVNPSNGVPYCDGKTYEQYGSAGNGMFIGKQTLENVIAGKGLTTKSYVDGLVGDINTTLDTINGEVI